jgi:predicted transcriptional regulator
MDDFSNEAYYQLFSSLASRTSLRIIEILKKEPKSIVEIANELNEKEKNIAKRIEELEHCAIIRSDKSEKARQYSLNKEIIEPLSEILEFHTSKYCPGLKECISPEKLRNYMKKEASRETYIEH